MSETIADNNRIVMEPPRTRDRSESVSEDIEFHPGEESTPYTAARKKHMSVGYYD